MDAAQLISQLGQLGIRPGDTVLININLSKFGLVSGYSRKDYLNLFLDYLGEEGTLVAYAFTPLKLTISDVDLPVFTPTAKATTGAFANAMLAHPDHRRSTHPSNSIVAIGKEADAIVAGLDERSKGYEFVRRVIERAGKILLVGVQDYPGFVTHLVEADLGLHDKYWYGYFLKCRLEDGTLYRRLDPGGCSKTFDRVYPLYIREELLKIGTVGEAYSLCMVASDAYEVDYKAIKEDPNIFLCDSPDCLGCRIGTWAKIWYLPVFFVRKAFRRIIRELF